MRTVVRVMAITAVMAGALSLDAAWGADRPTANRGGELCFELVDGTVVTGRLETKVIAIRIASGNVLEVPAAALKEVSVGLNDLPGLVKRIEALLNALDSDHTRRNAVRELIALGPAIAPIVKRHAASNIPARRAAVAEILAAYESWSTIHPDAPEALARPLEARSKVRTSHNTFLGAVSVRQLKIASPYGSLIVKPGELRRIGPAAPPAPSKRGRWSVELRDKTRIEGMAVSKSLRIETRYGAMVVPLARIEQATFAADGKSVRIKCWGPDRIVGAADPKTIVSLKTLKGRVNLPAGKIILLGYGPVTLRGHLDYVCAIAFSPDGKRVASGSWDHTVRLWNTSGGKELLVLKGHSGEVRSVAFSPDGRRLASGSFDKTIKLWGTAKGTELLAIRGHSDKVHSVAFSPDGKRVASGGRDNTVKIWDSVGGKELLALKGHSHWVASVAFSPDGKRLASGSHDKTTRLWDAVTGKELLTLKGHANGVWFIAFSPDGKSLVSASNVGIMKLWDTLTGKELLTFRARLGYMHSIALSPDGRRLAVAFDVGIIKLWDTLTGKELLAFKAHAHGVWSVAFSPDGRLLASGGGDRIIKLWDTLDWTRSAKGMRKVKVTGDSRNTPAAKNLRQYVVKERDTLWGIALAVYGQGKHWRLIVEANPGIRPAALKVGQVLVIPPMPKPANRPAK